jgi:hypothetical protein
MPSVTTRRRPPRTLFSSQAWYDAEGERQFGNPHGSPFIFRTVAEAEADARDSFTAGVLRADVVAVRGPLGAYDGGVLRVVRTIANPAYEPLP